MKKGVAEWCMVAMVVVLVAAVHGTSPPPPNCNPSELRPCLPAIAFGLNPSQQCCSKLKEQQPCFCSYIRNPEYGQYVNSPNARRVAANCGVTIPTNC